MRKFNNCFFIMKPQLPRPLFAVIRFLYAALAVADLVWIGLDHPRGEWIIHFGNWSRVVTALYFLLGSITAFHRSCCGSKASDQYNRIDDDKNQEYSFLDPSGSSSCALRPGEKDVSITTRTNRLSWHHEVLWVLHTLASNSSFACLIAYFTFFFKERYTFIGVLDFPRHVLYLILMIFDTLASHIPVRLWHFMYAYIFGASYVVFTIIFILTEIKVNLGLDPAVYPSLEIGDQPLIYTAYLSIFLIAGFPLAQILFFLIYKFRANLGSS